MPSTTLLRDFRRGAGMSQRQLSDLAGVAPSSVSRIEAGTMSPTADVLDRLWDALGCTTTVDRSVDPRALVASRSLLGDSSVEGMDGGRWTEIFERLGDVELPARLLWRASRFARLIERPATTGWIVGSGGAIVNARAFGGDWAWTGALAARAYGTQRDTTPAWLTAYADTPSEFLRELGATTDRPTDRATPVAVYRSDDIVLAGRWRTSAGDWSVAPLQAAVDCYGGTGRMPEDADILLERMGFADAGS